MPTPTPVVAPILPAGSVQTKTNEVWNAYLAHRAAEKYTVVLRTIIVVAVVATCAAVLRGDLYDGISWAAMLSIVVSLLGTASLLRFTMFGKHHVESLITGVFTGSITGRSRQGIDNSVVGSSGCRLTTKSSSFESSRREKSIGGV